MIFQVLWALYRSYYHSSQELILFPVHTIPTVHATVLRSAEISEINLANLEKKITDHTSFKVLYNYSMIWTPYPLLYPQVCDQHGVLRAFAEYLVARRQRLRRLFHLRCRGGPSVARQLVCHTEIWSSFVA